MKMGTHIDTFVCVNVWWWGVTRRKIKKLCYIIITNNKTKINLFLVVSYDVDNTRVYLCQESNFRHPVLHFRINFHRRM